ncbi:hypothetical protein HKBW3S09_01230 [Candidatus Hakubella thermalkaliphila]|uniref:Uncharacterized protein n=1 Tax=Candidatus Hakubella thermalkaliphila TaxID=2754717 RepID=A0A6V8NTZ8_9ACTN|nr:hypothetical protein HKBW3S09_01230 [Candidatus Hakubella thermalkaliphila]
MLDPLSSYYLLNEETKEKLKAIDRVDIVVGIPSYNNAGTIGKVVSEVGRGLRAHFPPAGIADSELRWRFHRRYPGCSQADSRARGYSNALRRL